MHPDCSAVGFSSYCGVRGGAGNGASEAMKFATFTEIQPFSLKRHFLSCHKTLTYSVLKRLTLTNSQCSHCFNGREDV